MKALASLALTAILSAPSIAQEQPGSGDKSPTVYSANHALFLERLPSCLRKKEVFVLRDVLRPNATGIMYGCHEDTGTAVGFYVPVDSTVRLPELVSAPELRPNFDRESLCSNKRNARTAYQVTNELQKHRGEVEVCREGGMFDARGKLTGFKLHGITANLEIAVQGVLKSEGGAEYFVRIWPSKGFISLKSASRYLHCRVEPSHTYSCVGYEPRS